MEETLIDENGVVIKKSEKFKEEMQRIRDDILFSVTDDEGENLMHQFIEILQCETASQLGRTPSDFNVDLNTYDPWNLFRTLQIMVNEADTNMTFSIDNNQHIHFLIK